MSMKSATSGAESRTRSMAGSGMSLLTEFKAFILRGNVVDLAIGIVIGVAFGAVVNAFVQDIIMPLIGAFGGKPNFDSYYWVVNGSRILVGTFITALVAFVILAAVIFFFVVKPMNALIARRKTEPPADPTTRDCPYCLSNIPIQATRCAFCTQEVPAVETVEVVPAEATVEA